MRVFPSYFSYLKYLWCAKNEHGVHSPFVFDLLTEVIYDTTPYYIFEPIEKVRNELKGNRQKITVQDFGAGSKKMSGKQRRISDIARHSLKSPKFAQLLFRLVNRFQPEHVLELGTSLGVTTLYLSTPNKKAPVVTLEGCPEIAGIASNNFKQFDLENIRLLEGNFDETLPEAIGQMPCIDFLFLDGNHRKAPVIEYFDQCAEKAGEHSVFVIDDIHWSEGMEAAWEAIQKHPKVTLTLDLYFMGLVFFRKEQLEKEHFVVRF